MNDILRTEEIRWTSDHVLILDITTFESVGITGLPLDDCRTLLWDCVSPEWTPRINKLVEEMLEVGGDSIRLVEVIFFDDEDNIAAVLAQIREDSPAHYQILTTISRVW